MKINSINNTNFKGSFVVYKDSARDYKKVENSIKGKLSYYSKSFEDFSSRSRFDSSDMIQFSTSFENNDNDNMQSSIHFVDSDFAELLISQGCSFDYVV